ncbi:hypothetical protein C5167_028630 [Papaver somniferum]|uniref:uncharacterized protein LOC113338364 n=1 Tax=Papaver somniferum TaxID=3469 RepID=UPI000E6FAB16|nr:uncharacterized protein LOC113338364 [Papaver somniferum]RZC90799.1 hypothetical protein C5167_028630 [Papaver somniferum]
MAINSLFLLLLLMTNLAEARPLSAAPSLAPQGEVFVPTSSRDWPNEDTPVNWPLVGGILAGGFLLFALLVVGLCYCTAETPVVASGGGPGPTSATAERGGELVVLDQADQPQRLVWRAFR